MGECQLMNSYYVVGIATIPHIRFGLLINIVCNEGIAYHVTIGDLPLCTCPNFTKMSSQSLRRKGKGVYCKHLNCVFRILCKVDYNNDKFIHSPT